MAEFVLSYSSHLKLAPFASKEFKSISKHIVYIFFKFKTPTFNRILGLDENSLLKMYYLISQGSLTYLEFHLKLI